MCPDLNHNEAKLLDPDSMNPDPKHSSRFVPICGSRRTDEVIRYGTYTVSPDPDSMNPDPKHSSRFVPICGSRAH